MAKCSLCGSETYAHKLYEDDEWKWFCGECWNIIKVEAKLKKIADGKLKTKHGWK